MRLGRGEPTNVALTTLYQAQLARLQGDLVAAERLLDEAVQRYADLSGGKDVARDLSQVALEYGLVARDRGERAKAISLFREALGALREADDPGAASLAHFHLAFELIQADEVAEAVQHAVASFMLDEADGRRLQDPAERRSFYREHRDTYGLAMHCAARAGDGRTAFTIAVAARSEALAAFVRAGARLAPHLQELIDQIALAAAEAEQGPADQKGAAAARLEELYARLEYQTSRQMRQAMTGHWADPDETIATLPVGGHALLLDVLEEDDTICNRVWVSPVGEIKVDEVIFPAPVRHFLDSYHDARERAAWQPQQHKLAELGQAVLPPGLAAALGSGQNPPLIISTGSLLGPVPVAALRINERFLVEQAQLALVPSMALWAALRMRPARTGRGTLAFLDPDLPSSPREEAALCAALSPVRRVDSRQLRAGLADASRYAAVVISAHGTPPEAGDMPGGGPAGHAGLAQALALTGGDRLTAAELLTCRLPDALITPSCWSARLTVRAAVEPLGLPPRPWPPVRAGSGWHGRHRRHHDRLTHERVLPAAPGGQHPGCGAAACSGQFSPAAAADDPGHLGGPHDRGGRFHPARGSPPSERASRFSWSRTGGAGGTTGVAPILVIRSGPASSRSAEAAAKASRLPACTAASMAMSNCSIACQRASTSRHCRASGTTSRASARTSATSPESPLGGLSGQIMLSKVRFRHRSRRTRPR